MVTLRMEKLQQAEIAVFGSMLIDEAVVGPALQRITLDDFVTSQHRHLFEAVCSVFASGRPVDPVTVLAVAGNEYRDLIMSIMTATPTAANWEAYADVLHDEALLLRMQRAAEKIVEAGDLEEARRAAEKTAAPLAEQNRIKVTPFSRGIVEFYERQTSKIKPDYLPWKLGPLDDILTAEPGDFIILGGYPSAGKTVLAGQFALTMAAKLRVGIFSLETKDRKLYDRLIAYAAKVPFQAIKRHTLTDEDITHVVELGTISDKIHLDVINAAGMNVMDIRAVSLANRYDVIFIDYLQLLKSSGKDRFEKVTNISLDLHELAGTTGITVIALAQLSRPDKSAKNKPPTMASIRESGQVEQDADIIMLLYLDDEDLPDGDRLLKIAKNKDGERGYLRLGFYSKYLNFFSKSKKYEMPPAIPVRFKPVAGEDAQTELPF